MIGELAVAFDACTVFLLSRLTYYLSPFMVNHVSLYVGDRAYVMGPFVWRTLYRQPIVP